MEEIIGLLVILATAIFKAVIKKLENAGKTSGEPEVFVPQGDPVVPMPEPVVPQPRPAAPKRKPKPSTVEVVERQTQTRKPMLVEEEEKGPKERIDPKKLVLYSEIMTPKFNE